MELKDILAIAGQPGLYRYIAQSRTGFIVESLLDGKRSNATASSRVSALSEISMFTEGEDIPLAEVFTKMYAYTEGKQALSHKEADAKPRKQISRSSSKKVTDPFAAVKTYLTDFSVNNAQKIFDKWVALEQLLLVKFIDGNVKAQNEDGSFVTNEHTDCIPDKITQPGYTEKWKEIVAKDHGKTIEER